MPERKAGKNRLHVDVVSSERLRDVERLVRLGARRLAEHTGSDGSVWTVLADPEGNEFCVCDP